MKHTTPSLDRIAAALDSSEADIEAGRTIPADEIDRMMQDRIDRLEARLSASSRRAVPTRR